MIQVQNMKFFLYFCKFYSISYQKKQKIREKPKSIKLLYLLTDYKIYYFNIKPHLKLEFIKYT